MTTRQLLGLALLPLFLFVGCGKKTAPAKVSGTITYNGQPVTGGILTFHSDAGVYTAAIAADGSYALVDVPVGDMVATVDTEGLNPNVKTEVYKGQSSGGMAKYGPKGGGADTTYKGKAGENSPAGEGSPQGTAGTYVKIPRIYADKTKSTLKVSVKDGAQTIDLQLKD